MERPSVFNGRGVSQAVIGVWGFWLLGLSSHGGTGSKQVDWKVFEILWQWRLWRLGKSGASAIELVKSLW